MSAGSLTRDQLSELIEEHCVPGPGPGLVAVRFRAPYERQQRMYYVPEEEIIRACSAASQASASGDNTASTPTTSAGVAPGRTDSAIARAVIRRSYTRTAARPSSVRPIRSTMRRRASKASVLLFTLMALLQATQGAAHGHVNARRAGGRA